MNKPVKTTINLIADIGGTNIRLALADKSFKENYKDIETYQCAKFDSLADVLALYIESKQLNGFVINACLAIACPVDNDLISMTNLPWQFSQTDLKAQLKLNNLTLINDYTAIAMAIPLLNNEQKVKIGGGEMVENNPISVCGPGTGLGVANLVPVSIAGINQWHCIGGEGGHVDFAPVDEQESNVLRYLSIIKKRVSYEQLLSGYGIEQIYQALVNKENGEQSTTLTAQEISKQAIDNSCPICHETLLIFCRSLGSFAGNLALIMNSLGGVYIAGGIVPRFIDFLKASQFRERFESKGRLSHITLQTPTYVITEQQPGLLGAAAYLFQQ
jgi:glucokinase